MSRTPSSLMKSRFFRAGAGAGKTTTLVREVIRLATEFEKHEARAPRMIVTTFTRKATQELKERLLEEGIRSESESLLHFVTSPSLLMISTIHGILVQFLTQMSGALGLDSEFRLVDDGHADRKWKSCLRQLLIEDSTLAELLERFSFSQLSKFARSYVLRAVSGTPPSVLTEELIWRDVQTELSRFHGEILKVQARLGANVLSAAWDDICMAINILRESSQSCKTSSEWSDVRQRWNDVVESLVVPRGKARKEVDDLTIDELKSLKDELETFNDLEFDPRSWRQMAADALMLDQIGRSLSGAWKKEKLESGELSIEDLEVLSLSLINEFPLAAAQFSEQWDYWFVDEYQDTSPSQVSLLKNLIGKAGHFIVGDPQQSIYFFRGARSEVFFQKEREFQARGFEIEYLKTNRRSRPPLLHFFNDFFRTLERSQFQMMEPNPAGLSTVLAAGLAGGPAAQDTVARFFILPERAQELDAIVWQIGSWTNSGYLYKDMAVLTRTHQDLQDVADRLNKAEIPTQIISAGGFYDRREIMDALALLRFLVNPKDDVNVLALVRSPWLYIEDLTLTSVLGIPGRSQQESVWQNLQGLGQDEAAFDVIKKMTSYLAQTDREGVSATFSSALEELGFFSFCHIHDVTGVREANLWKLVQKLKQEEHRVGFSLVEFVAKAKAGLEDGLDQNDGDAVSAFEPNRVMLLTVHASKGLGIPHVILPFIQKDLYASRRETFLYDEEENRWLTASPSPDGSQWMYPPSSRKVVQRIQTLEREEHDRLLYVALTRARENVMLTASGKAGSHSWLKSIGLDLSVGPHNTENYTYEVRQEVPPTAIAQEEARVVANEWVRTQWTKPPGQEKLQMISARDKASNRDNLSQMRRRLESMRRGIRTHKLLEVLVRRGNRAVVDDQELEASSAFEDILDLTTLGIESSDPDFEIIHRSIRFLVSQNEIPYLRLVRSGHAEWGFVFRVEETDVRGQIDLWGEVDGQIWIIDYKTGSFEFREQAFQQLQTYAEALRASGLFSGQSSGLSSGRTKKILLAAVYPLQEKIEIREF